MKLVLDNAVEFKKAIDAISVLIDEAEFTISEEGLKLKATDPSQISMIDFKLPKTAFSEYELEKETKIGLDLDYLSQIMSRSKQGEKLILELNEKESRLKVQLKGSSTRNFFIQLLDISSTELPSPKLESDAVVKANAGLIKDGLKDALLVSTHVTLGVTSKNFFIKANSSKGESINEITKEDENLKELNAKKECYAMFPLNYLQDMLKSADSNTLIELQMKSNAPIKIIYSIGNAELEYFLAPRIESS